MISSVSKQKARKTFRETKYLFFHKSDRNYNIEAWGAQQTQFTGIDGSEKYGLLEAWVLNGLWSWLIYTIYNTSVHSQLLVELKLCDKTEESEVHVCTAHKPTKVFHTSKFSNFGGNCPTH